MSDLLHDVRHSFETLSEATGEPTSTMGPVSTYQMAIDAVDGLEAMRSFNEDRIKAALRRAYRHFGGATLSKDNDEVFDMTKNRLGALFSALVIETFCDGIQIGSKTEPTVQMALATDETLGLFHDHEFRAASLGLALEITSDDDVGQFFTNYVVGCAMALGHVTGFAHGQDNAHKIWDLWLMAGTSMVSAGYIAGCQLGKIWTEREVVAGMETAMETDDDS